MIDDLIKSKEEAKILIEEIKQYPNDYNVHIKLGDILRRFDEYNKAENEFKEALKIIPNSFEAHCTLGILFYNFKRYEDGERELREALKLNPNYLVLILILLICFLIWEKKMKHIMNI